jgi:hypothetical protein
MERPESEPEGLLQEIVTARRSAINPVLVRMKELIVFNLI